MSLVAVPMWTKLSVWINGSQCYFNADALVGVGFCMYTYSIHVLMSSSDMAGTPFENVLPVRFLRACSRISHRALY